MEGEGEGGREGEGDGGVRKRRRRGGNENPLCVQPACLPIRNCKSFPLSASLLLSLLSPLLLLPSSPPPPPRTAPVLPADKTEMMDDVACSALKDDGVEPTKTRSSLPAIPRPPTNPPRQDEKWDARDADREQQGAISLFWQLLVTVQLTMILSSVCMWGRFFSFHSEVHCSSDVSPILCLLFIL